jgi:hypothetical protein
MAGHGRRLTRSLPAHVVVGACRPTAPLARLDTPSGAATDEPDITTERRSPVQLRETPGNLSALGSETHQHFSPVDANCCQSLSTEPTSSGRQACQEVQLSHSLGRDNGAPTIRTCRRRPQVRVEQVHRAGTSPRPDSRHHAPPNRHTDGLDQVGRPPAVCGNPALGSIAHPPSCLQRCRWMTQTP